MVSRRWLSGRKEGLAVIGAMIEALVAAAMASAAEAGELEPVGAAACPTFVESTDEAVMFFGPWTGAGGADGAGDAGMEKCMVGTHLRDLSISAALSLWALTASAVMAVVLP